MALVWPWYGLGVALYSGVYAYYMALQWLCSGFAVALGGLSVQGRATWGRFFPALGVATPGYCRAGAQGPEPDDP